VFDRQLAIIFADDAQRVAPLLGECGFHGGAEDVAEGAGEGDDDVVVPGLDAVGVVAGAEQMASRIGDMETPAYPRTRLPLRPATTTSGSVKR